MGAESGLRKLKPSEVLFNDGDKAHSLFIIQKGQLRLFKPKGKGFVEIAVLRAGEVIGEMAFFDTEGGGRRSCSASAMTECEVIEISFGAFEKTMQGLNPWFKTIINTLADRLRTTNSRVKELESNSAGLNYGGSKSLGYEFLKAHDLLKCLGTLFLVVKSHAHEVEGGLSLLRKTISFYLKDIYMIHESKFDEVMLLLKEMDIIDFVQDPKTQQEMVLVKDLDFIRSLFIFYNTQRHLTEDKKLRLSKKCVHFLSAIRNDSVPNDSQKEVCLTKILESFKREKLAVDLDDLEDARGFEIVGASVVGENNEIYVEVNWDKLYDLLPKALFLNKIAELNEKKA